MREESDERMIPLEEALATLDRVLEGRLVEVQDAPVREAVGRVLAEAPVSLLDLPPFNKSAMDGYAVMENDVRESYRVLECVPAGRRPTRPLEPGAATKIMTGAPVPTGTGRVVMIEDTDGGNEVVRVWRHAGKTNLCPRGEDLRAGDTVLALGTVLDSVAVAGLLSCGITSVRVRRRVTVCIISTGDELVETPEQLAPGKIIDSNGPMLESLCRACGMEVVSRRVLPDVRERLAGAIAECLPQADILVLTGGVSEGDLDCVPDAMRDVGLRIHFDRIAVKPGKPLTFASDVSCAALGLPGNPVSVFLGFHLFVRRAARLLSGRPAAEEPFSVLLAGDYRRRNPDRSAFVPCRLNSQGQAEAIDYHGSAHLLALCAADGFFCIPPGTTRAAAGQRVAFYPLLLCR